MLARQEGCEDQALKSIDTVSGMQTSTMESQDDIAPLFERLKQRKGYVGRWMSASAWGEALKLHAPYGGLPSQLEKLIASSARLSNRMEQSATRLGIQVRSTGRVKEYRIGGGADEASLHADLGLVVTPTKPTKL
jgi:hypothetical protein